MKLTTNNQTHNLDPLGDSKGSKTPYVIGFVLSLILTIIPYMLVVKKISIGGRLLEAILLFAVLQLLVQTVFFLHIGRGPKPAYNLFFLVSTIGVLAMIVGFSIWIMNNLNYNMMPEDVSSYIIQDEGISSLNNKDTNVCHTSPRHHHIKIIDGQAYPSLINADRCDSLTFTNSGAERLELLLSGRNNSAKSPNYLPTSVRPGRDDSIVLYQTGEYDLLENENILAKINITNTDNSEITSH